MKTGYYCLRSATLPQQRLGFIQALFWVALHNRPQFGKVLLGKSCGVVGKEKALLMCICEDVLLTSGWRGRRAFARSSLRIRRNAAEGWEHLLVQDAAAASTFESKTSIVFSKFRSVSLRWPLTFDPLASLICHPGEIPAQWRFQLGTLGTLWNPDMIDLYMRRKTEENRKKLRLLPFPGTMPELNQCQQIEE